MPKDNLLASHSLEADNPDELEAALDQLYLAIQQVIEKAPEKDDPRLRDYLVFATNHLHKTNKAVIRYQMKLRGDR